MLDIAFFLSGCSELPFACEEHNTKWLRTIIVMKRNDEYILLKETILKIIWLTSDKSKFPVTLQVLYPTLTGNQISLIGVLAYFCHLPAVVLCISPRTVYAPTVVAIPNAVALLLPCVHPPTTQKQPSRTNVQGYSGQGPRGEETGPGGGGQAYQGVLQAEDCRGERYIKQNSTCTHIFWTGS